MLKDLTPDQKVLSDFMSDISERCYYAGWMKNLEHVLWDAITSGQRKYGHADITSADINTLKTLADKSNSWIIYDDDLDETALDLNVWTSKFRADIKKDPSIIE